MSKELYTYYLDAWSTDTRSWTIKSKNKLTEDEIREAWLSNPDMNEGNRRGYQTDNGNTVIIEFDGTNQGDGGEYEINGDAVANVVDSN